MLSNKIRALAAASLLVFAGAATAEVLSFQFTGTVTYSRDAAFAPVGSPVRGTFSYEEGTAPEYHFPGQAYYMSPESMSATVNGHEVTSDRLGVDVFDNTGASPEDMAIVTGYPVMVEDQLLVDGTMGLYLMSAQGSTEALPNTDLPTIYHLEDFDINANSVITNYGYLQEDGGQTGTIVYFSVDSITGGHESCSNKKGKPKKCKKAK
jgi:hypothetical protein